MSTRTSNQTARESATRERDGRNADRLALSGVALLERIGDGLLQTHRLACHPRRREGAFAQRRAHLSSRALKCSALEDVHVMPNTLMQGVCGAKESGGPQR